MDEEKQIEHLYFLIDYLVDSLGPASDDILAWAEEAWRDSQCGT